MAFDFGLRRIGVAVGQELLGTGEPLALIPARDGIPDWAPDSGPARRMATGQGAGGIAPEHGRQRE